MVSPPGTWHRPRDTEDSELHSVSRFAIGRAKEPWLCRIGRVCSCFTGGNLTTSRGMGGTGLALVVMDRELEVCLLLHPRHGIFCATRRVSHGGPITDEPPQCSEDLFASFCCEEQRQIHKLRSFIAVPSGAFCVVTKKEKWGSQAIQSQVITLLCCPFVLLTPAPVSSVLSQPTWLRWGQLLSHQLSGASGTRRLQ